MSKMKRSQKRPNSQCEDGYGPRLFSPDLDGSAYEEFYQYRRPPGVEEKPSEHAEVETPDLDPHRQQDLDEAIEQIVRTRTLSEEEQRNARKEPDDIIAAILREFETKKFDGPDDWIYRKSFKDNLRDTLAEFLNQPAAGHVFRKAVLAPLGYQLSGQQIGGSLGINPKGNFDQILLAALVWKSRRTLGLLWTLVEQNQDGAAKNETDEVLDAAAQVLIAQLAPAVTIQ